MSRTTLNIDKPVLDKVRDIQKREGRSLGEVVSRLLADALSAQQETDPSSTLEWTAKPMGARVDLDDKDELYATLDEAGRE